MNWRNNGRKDIPGFTPNFKELAARIDSEHGQEPPPPVVTEYAGLRARNREANEAAIAEVARSTSAIVLDVDAQLERARVGMARAERLRSQFNQLVQNAGNKVIEDFERQHKITDDICALLEEGIKKMGDTEPTEPRPTRALTKADVMPPPSSPEAESAS